MSSHKVYAISGLSATGKTTIGRRIENDFLIDEVKHIEFIDQDWYYKDNKPKVLLSSGENVSNWDCVEAIYWGTLNADIKYKLKSRDVLLVGFALWESLMEFPIERHVHLTYSQSHCKKDIQKCIDGRIRSKKLKTLEKREKDRLMVEEIVFPFYLETLKKSKIDDLIAVYDEKDNRRDINELVREVEMHFFQNTTLIGSTNNPDFAKKLWDIYQKGIADEGCNMDYTLAFALNEAARRNNCKTIDFLISLIKKSYCDLQPVLKSALEQCIAASCDNCQAMQKLMDCMYLDDLKCFIVAYSRPMNEKKEIFFRRYISERTNE